MPFVSKEKGRMSHLLKLKSKIGVQRKDRVVYDVFDFEKRIRNPSTNPQSQIILNTQSQTQTQAKSPPKKVQPTVLEKFDTPMGNK